MMSIAVGGGFARYTAMFYPTLDENMIPLAVKFLVAGFSFYILGFLTSNYSLKKKVFPEMRLNENFYTKTSILWIAFICSSLPLFYTYTVVGYVPIFHDLPGSGAKYFQDAQSAYIPLRPYYTFGLNLASASLLSSFMLFLLAQKSERYKYVFFIVIFSIILLSTSKRGPLLTPYMYLGLGYFLCGKIGLIRLMFYMVLLIFSAALMHFVQSGNDYEIVMGLLFSLMNSFFVSVREMARFLSVYNGDSIYGMSYLASILSFIPTELSEIKETYLFPRYLIYLEDGDPNLSGGPRATYIAEAFLNFGVVGVVIISWIAGFFSTIILTLSKKISFCSCNDLCYGIFCAFILQQGILAFYENGSAFLFHFLSKFLFLFLILKFSHRRVREVLDENSNHSLLVDH